MTVEKFQGHTCVYRILTMIDENDFQEFRDSYMEVQRL